MLMNVAVMLSDSYEYGYGSGGSGTSIVSLVVSILLIVAYWRIFSKAGELGVLSIIPIVNTFIMFKIAMGSGWKMFLMLIPIFNIYYYFKFNICMAQSYGHGAGFGVGLALLPNIFYLILGFDSSDYEGPAA